MSQQRPNRRDARKPFVTTVAAAAGAALVSGALAGCANEVFFSGSGSGGSGGGDSGPGGCCGNPPLPPSCPENVPSQSDPCPEVGLSCHYEVNECEWADALCAGSWSVQWGGLDCNPPAPNPPPPPSCPPAMPEPWSDCDYEPVYGEYTCTYPSNNCPGIVNATATCTSGADQTGYWLVDDPICNPPPPSVLCAQYPSPASCASDAACQWLVPGCTDDKLPVPKGCHPKGHCGKDYVCPASKVCATASYDPCFDQTCMSCSADIIVCVPKG
jgi:hypothetical protein